jgi:hypothetical protein
MPRSDFKPWLERTWQRWTGAGLLGAAAALMGCAPLPQAPPQPAPLPLPATVSAPAPVAETVYVPILEPQDAAARHLLAYQQSLMQMSPASLVQEAIRLGDGSASVQAMMDLAVVLGYTRSPGDVARAQGVLDKILRNDAPQAEPWHGLARLLSTRYAEQRRSEEQVERLNQQLRDTQRDNQRKLDQLNDKLEALKAIERSLNSRPSPAPVPIPPASAAKPAK